jgi:hypothetical protein
VSCAGSQVTWLPGLDGAAAERQRQKAKEQKAAEEERERINRLADQLEVEERKRREAQAEAEAKAARQVADEKRKRIGGRERTAREERDRILAMAEVNRRLANEDRVPPPAE